MKAPSLTVSLVTSILVLLLALAVPFGPNPFLPHDEYGFDFEDFLHKTASNMSSSPPQNMIVTGGCSGLGLATVEHLARVPRSNIIMACRSMVQCLDAKQKITMSTKQVHGSTSLHCLELDLSSLSSIREFALQALPATLQSLSPQDPTVNVLINNAGQWSPLPELVYDTDDTQLEMHMLINHIGHVYLTHLLWKQLSSHYQAAPPRIIAVSSGVALFPVDSTQHWFDNDTNNCNNTSRFIQHVAAYSRSKRANLQFAAELHHRYNNTILALATHPGYSRTALLTRGMQFATWLGRCMFANKLGSMSPSQGAMTQVRAALDDHVSSGMYIGPKYLSYGPPVPLGRIDGWTLHHWPFSREDSRQLWDKSLAVLKIKDFGQLVDRDDSS